MNPISTKITTNKNVGVFKWKSLARDKELKGMSCQKASVFTVKF